MPQFEFLSFFNQSVYFLIFALFVFLFVLQYILPSILKVYYYRAGYFKQQISVKVLKPYHIKKN